MNYMEMAKEKDLVLTHVYFDYKKIKKSKGLRKKGGMYRIY